MMAPGHIDLVYRKVGRVHVFASKGIRGIVHVGGRTIDEALESVIDALGFHVEHTYGVPAKYVCDEADARMLSSRIAEQSGAVVGVRLADRVASCN